MSGLYLEIVGLYLKTVCFIWSSPPLGHKMIWLLVSVLCDSKCVGPKWVETQEQFTLADLLEQVMGGKYLEASVIVKTGKEEQSPMHDTVLHQPLSTFYYPAPRKG